jgi:cytochrome c oxidase cbb3-type subunit 1
MGAAETGGSSRSFELLTIHGLTWLTVGNAVGLLLATLLVFPRLGDWLAPLSFGRWVPLHLDFQLYGWCGAAIFGLLFRIYLPRGGMGRLPELAVHLWSGALAFAAVSWLTGHSDGKLFLEWSGAARVGLAVSLTGLEVVLIVAFVRGLRERVPSGGGRGGAVAKGLLLAALAPLPALMFWAAGPGVYPPINPDSGGATGGSLMGSSLLVVAIVLACPWIAGLVPRGPRGGLRAAVPSLVLFIAQGLWFALLDHTDRSHHEWLQIASLASLSLWIPVLYRYLRSFDWPATARPWLIAFCAWGAVLVTSGALMFLPGALERWKFTNALVGHAHLAMAGMVTSFNVLVLVLVNPRREYTRLFAPRRAFLLWQSGCALFVVTMMCLGTIEGLSDGIAFRPAPLVSSLYAARWVAGAAMLFASAVWLRSAVRSWRPA